MPEFPIRPVILLSIWAVPATLTILQMYVGAWVNQKPPPTFPALVPAAAEWLMWAALTPAIVRLGLRHGVGWPPRLKALLVHLGAIGLVSAARGVVYATVTRVAVDAGPVPLGPYLFRIVIGWLPIAAVVYGAIIAAGAALAYADRARTGDLRAAQLEARLAEAELAALRGHLHPHFLFNTMHTVAALVRGNDRAAAVDTLARLSELLRDLLRADAPDLVTLREELRFVRGYLAIETVRFQDRLRVNWDIDHSAEEVLVPRMILQPLVENAVRHGIGGHGDAGRLRIEAGQRGAALEIRVTDDGPGLSPEPPASRGTGTGLATVGARLRSHFGANASIVLYPATPRGVAAVLSLPFQQAG